jgi:ubiquinone/menaquinone biosynthesis C-methylase UbiE
MSLSPSAVLETAAGSGGVTRALAPTLPRAASYIVTDLNQPMLDDRPALLGECSRYGLRGVGRRSDRLAVPSSYKRFT